jgi:hypothetical protein
LDNEIVKYDLSTAILKQGRLPPAIVDPAFLHELLAKIENSAGMKRSGKTLLLGDTDDYFAFKLVAGYQRTSESVQIVLQIPLTDRTRDERLIFNYQFQPFLVRTEKSWEVRKIAELDGTIFASANTMFIDNIEHWDCQGMAPRTTCIGMKPVEGPESNCLRSIWQSTNTSKISKECPAIRVDDKEEVGNLWRTKFSANTHNETNI